MYDAIPKSWELYKEKLSRWKQGHLLTDLRITWLSPPGVDPITHVNNGTDQPAPAWHQNVRAEAFIICSQTCDLGATPPGDAHPFVLVAPLITHSRIKGGGLAKLAQAGKVQYLFPTLSPDPKSPERAWLADLRLIMPLSKSLLLQREPIEGFACEADSLAFGETLAQKFRRAALHENLSEALPAALKDFVQSKIPRSSAFTKVEQVRLMVLDRDRLNPGRAQLYVYADDELNEDERAVWAQFTPIAARVLSVANIAFAGIAHTSANKQNAATYRQTVPVRCNLLGHTRYP